MIERHPYTSYEQWKALRASFDDLTASTIGALAGLHPYETEGGLFYAKSGVQMPEVEDSTAIRRGRLLEGAVAAAVQEAHPLWQIKKANEYVRDPTARLGATPDYYFVDDANRNGCLQAKTVAPIVFKQQWTETSAPAWIALQNLTECMLTDSDVGLIAALVVDGYEFRLVEIEVPRHEGAEKKIRDLVFNFWANVASGTPPKTDYERDARLLPILFPRETPGLEVDLRADNELPTLLDEREQLIAKIKKDEARKETIETEIRFKLGAGERGLLRGWRITNRLQFRKAHEVKATSFRKLNIVRDNAA